MKTTVLSLLAILIFFPLELNAQQKSNKVKTYKVWVELADGSLEKGVLYSADEQGLEILYAKSIDYSNVMSIEASKINVIKLRRKGNVGKGVGIGALGGITVGAIIASSTKEEEGFLSDFANDINTAFSIVLGGTVGTGIGAIASSSKKVIEINNNLDVYKEQLSTIQSYSLKLEN